MERKNVSLNVIEGFLAQRRIALVGISRERQGIGVQLMEEFRRHGYEVIPVNPNATEISGERCFARVQDAEPKPDAALLLTSPAVTNSVVRDCLQAGVKMVWMYRGGVGGAVSAEAVEFCRANGMEVVPGQCPFMYLAPVHGVHRIHRFFSKILGSYPKHADGTA